MRIEAYTHMQRTSCIQDLLGHYSWHDRHACRHAGFQIIRDIVLDHCNYFQWTFNQRVN